MPTAHRFCSTRPAASTAVLIMVMLTTLALGRQAGAEQPAPLTLDDVVHEALAHSPELQPQDDAVALASINRRLADARFGLKIAPSFSAGSDPITGRIRTAGLDLSKQLVTGGALFMNASSYQFGPSTARTRDTGYTVGLSQPLLRGFGRAARAPAERAARAVVTARRDRQMAREALVVQVARQFFEVVKEQRLLAAARLAANRAAQLETASEARTRVGLATELDVLRARILSRQVGARVATGEAALAAATDSLALLIGRPLGAPLAVSIDPAALTLSPGDGPPVSTMDLSTLVRRAIGARLDVQEARDAIDDAVRDEAVAQWNQLPPLSADVSYTQRGIGSADGGLDPLLGGWRFGLSTTYALDHAASAATAAAASVSVAAARRRAGQVEARATAEVRRLYAASRAADTTVALQHDAAALAARELQLANLRFERGLASSLDVVSAQDGLLQAENAEIAAELDRTASLLDLRRATGQLELGELQP